jgi:Ca2+-binding RTX toxin-like protein
MAARGSSGVPLDPESGTDRAYRTGLLEDLMTETAKRPAALGQAELAAATGGVHAIRTGDDGNNVLFGTGGQDLLHGEAGDDRITADAGNDRLWGGDGADTMSGGAGADTMSGGAGHDAVVGGTGDDRIDGGAGNDTLTGGLGIDVVIGGEGDDVYVWSPGDGSEVIRDGTGVDTLRLLNTGLTLDQLQEALMVMGRGGENMLAPLSEDGTRLVVDGLSGQLYINGHTIDFSGINYIELLEEPGRG